MPKRSNDADSSEEAPAPNKASRPNGFTGEGPGVLCAAGRSLRGRSSSLDHLQDEQQPGAAIWLD